MHTKTKETFEVKASEAEGTAFSDSLLFTKDFTETDKGIYKLLSVSYKTAEEEVAAIKEMLYKESLKRE